MNDIPFCPTYDELLNPNLLSPDLYKQVQKAADDELNALNLFNISWKRTGEIPKIVLPSTLTGVDANIIVLLGSYFPTGSHKVGPAYSLIMEDIIDGRLDIKKQILLSPSTGNFGIGASYVANLLDIPITVIMPENMSQERFDYVKKYGGQLKLVPASDTPAVAMKKTAQDMMSENKVYRELAQFERFGNYRFHRYVTGNSILEAVQNIGNGRVAVFAVAPGSAGTIAAGDQLKKIFNECIVGAIEPYECATLAKGEQGDHAIAGIGDGMCMLIHNVLNTDVIVLIKQQDALNGVNLFYSGAQTLIKNGVEQKLANTISRLFGPSGVCNVLGAIKLAKHLALSAEENVVTVATDAFERYHSVMVEQDTSFLQNNLDVCFKDILLNMDTTDVYDVRGAEKNKLFERKEQDWLSMGYTKQFLEQMKDQDFWEDEYRKVSYYNDQIYTRRR